MAHDKHFFDTSYSVKLGSSTYYVLSERKKDRRNKYDYHIFDDRLIRSKSAKCSARPRSVVRHSNIQEHTVPPKQQSKMVHRARSVSQQHVTLDIKDMKETLAETINIERERLIDSLRTTMATEKDSWLQLMKKEANSIADQKQEIGRLYEEQKRSSKKDTHLPPIDLIKRTVRETLTAQNESSATLEQLEQKLVQTIEREIRKLRPNTEATQRDEINKKRDNDETINRLFAEQKQVLTDVLNRQEQQATASSHDLIKQVVVEALNSRRELQQSISHQDIERLERSLTQVIQREIQKTAKINDDIDVVARSQDIQEQTTKKHHQTKNDDSDTLTRLFAEQRQALTHTIAQQQQRTLSLDLIKRAVMEVLSEQSTLAPTTSTTVSTVDASRHRKKSTIVTNREVEIHADLKQTRIDTAFQQQRNAVVADKRMRDAVKQWSSVRSMPELVAKIKACGKNDLENAWLLFCWIGQNIRYDLYCKNNAAESVFQQRTGVCRGFVSLYHECCSLLSIECLEISGYAKQAFLKPGQNLKDSPHAWNAIVLGQYTHLLDPTWGAGGGDNTNELEDFYFLTSPEELIYTHYCYGHQLLDPEMSKEDFLSLPVMKSTYYRLNLNLLSPKQGFNETNQNLFKITIKIPEQVDVFAQLKVGDAEYPCNLHTLCQHDATLADIFNCYIAPPADGLYEIAIYAKTNNETTYRDAIYMRLHVSNVVGSMTFPLNYTPFSEHRCILIEPLGRLAETGQVQVQ